MVLTILPDKVPTVAEVFREKLNIFFGAITHKSDCKAKASPCRLVLDKALDFPLLDAIHQDGRRQGGEPAGPRSEKRSMEGWVHTCETLRKLQLESDWSRLADDRKWSKPVGSQFL